MTRTNGIGVIFILLNMFMPWAKRNLWIKYLILDRLKVRVQEMFPIIRDSE
jgi:hypothetical protein